MNPEILNIEPTKRSPRIVLEPGRLFMMGRSIIENPGTYYEQGLNWLSKLSGNQTGKIQIDLGFEYINTGSIKWLYILLRQLAEKKGVARRASIRWYYEQGDDDMKELGSILRSLVECPFDLIEVQEMNDSLYESFISVAN